MRRHAHQGFLQKYPYETIDLAQLKMARENTLFYLDYREQTALTDATGNCIRTIKLSELDEDLSTKEDWTSLTAKLHHVHTVVLIDDRYRIENDIVEAYADKTCRVYIQLFQQAGKECFYTDCRKVYPPTRLATKTIDPLACGL